MDQNNLLGDNSSKTSKTHPPQSDPPQNDLPQNDPPPFDPPQNDPKNRITNLRTIANLLKLPILENWNAEKLKKEITKKLKLLIETRHYYHNRNRVHSVYKDLNNFLAVEKQVNQLTADFFNPIRREIMNLRDATRSMANYAMTKNFKYYKSFFSKPDNKHFIFPASKATFQDMYVALQGLVKAWKAPNKRKHDRYLFNFVSTSKYDKVSLRDFSAGLLMLEEMHPNEKNHKEFSALRVELYQLLLVGVLKKNIMRTMKKFKLKKRKRFGGWKKEKPDFYTFEEVKQPLLDLPDGLKQKSKQWKEMLTEIQRYIEDTLKCNMLDKKYKPLLQDIKKAYQEFLDKG